MTLCKICGFDKKHHSKGICVTCYNKNFNKTRIKKIVTCKKCGEEKEHAAFGLCRSCYGKQYHKSYIKPSNKIICRICKKEKELGAHGLCIKCYKQLWIGSITNKGTKVINPKSATYLGVHIAEKVLSKVFKDVTQMPPNNAGYDFICSKGKKIDVKSSVLRFDKRFKNHKGNWKFNINKNTTPDYFLIIAFDSRTSLTPQHLWLIPSNKISHLNGLSIAISTINKWSKYSQPLDKVISCCNELKKPL